MSAAIACMHSHPIMLESPVWPVLPLPSPLAEKQVAGPLALGRRWLLRVGHGCNTRDAIAAGRDAASRRKNHACPAGRLFARDRSRPPLGLRRAHCFSVISGTQLQQPVVSKSRHSPSPGRFRARPSPQDANLRQDAHGQDHHAGGGVVRHHREREGQDSGAAASLPARPTCGTGRADLWPPSRAEGASSTGP